jgi:hypothetical protein
MKRTVKTLVFLQTFKTISGGADGRFFSFALVSVANRYNLPRTFADKMCVNASASASA